MISISTKYAYHIDKLRREAKIKVDDFCNGICSDRQYRRYLSGEQEITQRNIILFAEKLGLRPSDFFNSFYVQDIDESKKVSDIYILITNNEWEIVNKKIDKMKNYRFLNIQSKKFYEYCIIRYKYETNNITKFTAYDFYKKLVNYPTCLNKKIYNFVDIITIFCIAKVEAEIGKEEALVFLYKILFDRKFVYVSSDTRYLLPSIYAGIAKILGIKKKFSESERISSIGIEYSLKIGDIHALPHLYSCKSMALHDLGKLNQSFIEAKKCLAAAIAKNDKQELEIFYNLFKNDYSINPMDLFLPNFIKRD